MCPLCSQNAHDQKVLACASDASRRVEGGRGRKPRAVEGNLGHSLELRFGDLEGSHQG
jgi:hypothetical protein